MKKQGHLLLAAGLWFLCLGVYGCNTAYYAAMEKIGKEKRHLLADNVEDVKDSQTEAKEEFKGALTRIRELYNFDGGELESVYDRLKASYEDCESRAGQIEKRILRVKTVAEDLFAEWSDEIQQIQDAKLRESSRKSRSDTQRRYQTMEKAMDKSARAMTPVLTRLKDYVLYLKHNLNAQAVGALGNEMVSIETDVTTLIRDMDSAIREAETFIANF